jgi:cell division protein FtsW (lipid II flippase)
MEDSSTVSMNQDTSRSGSRPGAVWVAIIVLSCFALVFWISVPSYDWDSAHLNVSLLMAILGVLITVSVFGLIRRKSYGRWIAIAFFSVMFIKFILISVTNIQGYGHSLLGLQREILAAVFAGYLIGMPLYSLAFGKKCKAYFISM